MAQPDERFERLTRTVMRAGGISGAEAENISSSPFLHARIRARIEAERRSRAEQGGGWLAALLIAWRAVAVLTLVTVAAALSFWFAKPAPSANAGDDDISRVIAGGTCALSATSECLISTEEVLATLFAEEARKERK